MFKDLELALANRGIKASLDESAIKLISDAGFDPVYGARPLRRALYELVEDKIADEILRENIASGDEIIITASGDEIIIKKA